MIKALTDNVIVQEVKIEERKTKGGLFVPSTAQEEPQKFGRVLAVGPKVQDVKVDDIVVFAKFGGQVFILNNEEYRALKEPELYCVLPNDESGIPFKVS